MPNRSLVVASIPLKVVKIIAKVPLSVSRRASRVLLEVCGSATVNDPKLKDLANYLNLALLFVWSTLKHYLILIVNNPCNAEL
jgi:hypothetical protein